MNFPYTSEDFQEVAGLLGREPRGLYKVIKRHPVKNHPMVIKVIPWVKNQPFPTLYWLTCPILKKEISHIEKDGWIGRFEKKYFEPDSELNEVLQAQHAAYRDERIELFNKVDGDWEKLPVAMQEILKKSGIGGISDFNHIKCFHLHYAHYLATGKNPVAELLNELFQMSRHY